MELENNTLYKIRPGRPGDLEFIISTWLKGQRYSNEWFKMIDKQPYYYFYKQVIERIIHSFLTTIKIACLADDEDVILGYAVYSDHVLHWVYVKRAWRKVGIAKSLIPSQINTVTHLTQVGATIIKPKKWIFNPFLIN